MATGFFFSLKEHLQSVQQGLKLHKFPRDVIEREHATAGSAPELTGLQLDFFMALTAGDLRVDPRVSSPLKRVWTERIPAA